MKRISSNPTTPTTQQKDDQPSQPLDLRTVRRTNESTPRTRERIFGLTEAPTYHPTTEEFKDPLKYIQQIQAEAEQYGIIKIVPPKDYKPDFCLNTEIFRFRTRIQKMNSMEGGTRTNLNYLEQIQKFHRLQGKPIQRIPQLDKRPIDLYNLKKVVAEKGGYIKVCSAKRWAEIGRDLGYTRRQCTSMSNALKNAYTRVVLPYETWLAKHRDGSTPLSMDTEVEPSDDDDNDDDDDQTSDETTTCEVCHDESSKDELLLCDDCDRGYHMSCVNPPLTTMPTSEWYCIKCLTAAGGDYGFEDGDEYSLSDFQSFCDKFKHNWFSKEKPVENPDRVPEEDCEDEFWRLVNDPHETCEVEYGADLHSTQHGSGFASIERGPNGVKGDDPWNLNMIPVLPDSLFTHIKSDISGMMVPWLYIGMCFSAFCWHNEDHFTYSINYMHWGETKTWYGVPGADTTKFEDTMRKAVPELFEQQPNLLFQLVTMLSPERLIKEKVRVYAVDQRPGEFVVTFPKAYHSGFNHGFNFCEAVNFAPVDWLHLGLECAKRYKEYRRQPCFSHDELLVNIVKMDLTNKNAVIVKDGLLEMKQRETDERNQFKQQHPRIKQVTFAEDPNNDRTTNDDHYQCHNCHCYTYLSYVTCPCTKKVACFSHADELCECPDEEKRVRLRFSDEELQRLVDIANHAAHTGSDWEAYARKAVSGDSLPSTHLLQHLLAEADKNGVPREETMQLRDHLDRIQHWERQAAAFLHTTTKQKRKPSAGAHRTLAHKTSPSLYNGERYRQLLDLRHRASTMAFTSPYLEHIETLVSQVNGLQKRSKELLAGNGGSINDIQAVLNQGLSLNMDYEELAQLQIAVDQRRWISELEPKAMQLPLDCDVLDNLLQLAHECKLPSSNPKYQDLLAKIRVGDQWIKRARRLRPDGNYGISNGGNVTMDELDEVLNVDQDVPTQRQLYQELQSFRMKVSSWLVLFTRTMMQCQQQQLLHRPSFQDIVELKDQLNELPLHMVQKESETLDMELERLDEWTNTVKRLLSYRLNGAKSFDTILENLQETIDHILAQHLKFEPESATAANSPKKKSKVGRRPAGSYCICHESESGFMIKCDVCAEWYHGACVKIAKRRLNHNEAYTCPVCDPASDFVHLSRRPKLEDLVDVMEDAKSLRFVPESYPVLQKMIMAMEAYRQELRIFCRSKPVLEVEDLDRIKQYLRELLGLPIALDDETEFLRKKVNDISTLLSRQNHHQYSTISNHSNTIPSSSHPYNSKHTLNPQIVPLSATTPADLDPHNHHTMPDKKRKLKAESDFPNKMPNTTPAVFESLPPPTTAGHPSVAPSVPSYY